MEKSEAAIQSEIFLHFWNNFPETRRLLFHIPNGGKRSPREAMKFKSMGVVKGIPDLFFAWPNGKYHGLFIEVKKPGEKVKRGSDQERVKYTLIGRGFAVIEFDNSEEAIEFIEAWLKD